MLPSPFLNSYSHLRIPVLRLIPYIPWGALGLDFTKKQTFLRIFFAIFFNFLPIFFIFFPKRLKRIRKKRLRRLRRRQGSLLNMPGSSCSFGILSTFPTAVSSLFQKMRKSQLKTNTQYTVQFNSIQFKILNFFGHISVVFSLS